jgi:ferritin
MLRNTQKNTITVNSIYEASLAEKDYQTQSFIMWFIDMQMREEALVACVLDRLRKMQSSDLGVIMFDSELAKKV